MTALALTLAAAYAAGFLAGWVRDLIPAQVRQIEEAIAFLDAASDRLAQENERADLRQVRAVLTQLYRMGEP